MNRYYLLILGEREAISWVLREQRMAFPSTPRAEVAALEVDDRLLLYATRGAWGNPTRDRGRIMGTATVCIDGLVPYPGGVELQPLVADLAAFPKPESWSIYLRRALLGLPAPDAKLLLRRLSLCFNLPGPLMWPRSITGAALT